MNDNELDYQHTKKKEVIVYAYMLQSMKPFNHCLPDTVVADAVSGTALLM